MTAASPTLHAAVRATDFVASIGINTAIGATWSAYGNFAAAEYALSYLGITNVRDAYRNGDDVYRFRELASQIGVSFNFHLDDSLNGTDWEIAQIIATPSLIRFVEGPNESDASPLTYGSLTGPAAAYAEQAALYAAVSSSSALTNATRTTPVIQASFAQVSSFSTIGNWSNVSNYGNSHEYFDSGLPPGSNIATYVSLAQKISPGQPVIATEAGYYTLPSSTGVDPLVQAKYDLTLLFDDWQAGIPVTYLFELLDEYADPSNSDPNDHFGLFNTVGAPKTAATAIHNLTALLNDPGLASDTYSLGYAINGLPSTGHSMLLSKSNGDFYIAIWNDVQLWNPSTASEISVAPVPITLTLGQTYQRIAIYDPIASTTATSSFANVSQVSISALDHPILVLISSAAAPQLSLLQPMLSKLAQSGQSVGNLWSEVLANAQETNRAYVSGLTIQSVNAAGARGSVSLNAATQTLSYIAAAYDPTDTADTIGYTLTDGHGGTASGTLRVVTVPPASTTYGMLPGGEYMAPGSGWTLYAKAPGQTLIGSSLGRDTFIGLGDTTIAAYGLGNVISAAAGNHVIATGDGNGKVTLGAGNNLIFGDGSGDVIVSGDGNTIVSGQTGTTRVTLGNGNQSVGLTGAGNTVSTGVGSSVVSAGDGGTETVTVAGGTNQIMVGGTGNAIHVVSGTSWIMSTGGQSRFQLDAGTSTLYAAGPGNTVTSGNGNTVMWGSTGSTMVTLGNGNNQIQLSGAGNTVRSGTGTNVVDAGSGGNETVAVAGGNNQIFLGGAKNTVTLSAGVNLVSATATQSMFTATSGINTISVTGTGNTITGGSGSDIIVALSGNNTLTSGSGSDQLQFAGSGNTIRIGSGATQVYDSGNANTIRLAARPASATQIYGTVMTNGDTFDLRPLLASTSWGGDKTKLGSFLSFQTVNGDAVLSVNATGAAGGQTYSVADFHSTGPLTLSGFLSHAIIG